MQVHQIIKIVTGILMLDFGFNLFIMLTICIPIFNFDVNNLIQNLSLQCDATDFPTEIILIDDCSDDKYKEINKTICSKYRYIKLNKNIGRAKIRNLFLKYAKYNNLLFLDCDSTIISNNYIKVYVDYLNNNKYDVVFGGRNYNKKKPNRNNILRWKYGVKQESIPLKTRLKFPNNSFNTSNFLINKKVFKKIKFNEKIINYGHEDTLFGYILKKNNYIISHINNPILNNDLEDNKEYLEKTETSIKNLISILNYVENKQELMNDISIYRFYNKMKSLNLIPSIYMFYKVSKPILKISFIKGYVNIKLFNFYKLGILIENLKH